MRPSRVAAGHEVVWRVRKGKAFVGLERPGWRQAVVKGWMRIVGLVPFRAPPGQMALIYINLTIIR